MADLNARQPVSRRQKQSKHKSRRSSNSQRASGLKIEEQEPVESETTIPLKGAIADFITDIRTFRRPMTTQKYDYILDLFAEQLRRSRM
jgi:hypothetical protein